MMKKYIKTFEEQDFEDYIDQRYKIEKDKSIIYDSETNKDICMYFDDDMKDWLLKILNSSKSPFEDK